MYQDKNKEWVIFGVDGPGCIYNFVSHHDLAVSDPIYRFYFDGNCAPAFEIKESEFGSKYPFIEPLAAKYEPKVKFSEFAIIRSFCPMPFKKSCKITSSVRLYDNAGDKGGGGWWYIRYHVYPTDVNVETFSGRENYQPIVNLWSKVGDDPKSTKGNYTVKGTTTVDQRDSTIIYQKSGSGYLASIKLHIPIAVRTFS